MNDIKIFKNDDLNAVQAVSARELYNKLTVGDMSHYSRWAKKNIIDNEFADENVDYIGFATMVNGNKTIDYVLTIDFAKELCMMSRSEKGKEIRKYFIQCEKALLSRPSYMIEDAIARARAWADEQEKARLALAKAEEEKQILIEENTELKEDNDHCRKIHNLKDEWGYSRTEICKELLKGRLKQSSFTRILIEDKILLDKDTINPLYEEKELMFKSLEKWSNNKGTSYVIKFTTNGKYLLEDYFNACIDSENVFIELSSSEKDVARIKKAIKDKPSKNKKTIENRNKRLNDAKSNLSSISSLYLAVLRERKEILKNIIDQADTE